MFTKGPVRPVYFVAEEEGKVLGLAGYVQSWMDWDVYEIFWVNVLPGRQRQGIGKELTEKIISEIRKKKDASLILLSATPINAKYYKDNFNFKVIGPSSKGYSLMGLSLLSEND
jgi:ribosomal protein S18 acetylase RimI-like enzyme